MDTNLLETPPAGAAGPAPYPIASAARRFGAALVDAVVTLCVVVAASAACAAHPSGTGLADETGWSLFFGGIFAFAFGHAVFLAATGQTIGKKLVGLRIVRPDGTAAGPLRLFFVRALLGWTLYALPVVGQVLLLFSLVGIALNPRRLTVHDRLADTIVVDVRGA